MSIRIKQLLRPPVFEGNEEKTRSAKLLNAILLTNLAILLVSGLIVAVIRGTLSGIQHAGMIVLLLLGLLFLMRLGHIRLAGGLLSFGLWGIATALILQSGGVRSPMSAGYVVVVSVVGLLFGERAVIVSAALSVAAGAGIFGVELYGYLPPASVVITPSAGVGVLIGSVTVTTVFLYLAVRSTNRSLKRTRRNERALAESNRELQETRIALEQHNEYLQETVQRYNDYVTQVGQGNLSTRLILQQYSDYVTQVGRGDLSARLIFNGRDHEDNGPLIVMGDKLNEMVNALQVMITQIQDASVSLNFTTTGILLATNEQSAGVSEQSAAVSQTTSTVDVLKTISEQATAHAQDVISTSQRTVEVSHAGQQAIQGTIESMYQIKLLVESIAENILTLSGQTQQVEDIIATVNDIATQSNILALNASVEAARAGEHGRGFAVVATEVRDLADRSKKATAQIRTILSDIQKSTNATVMATEEGIKGVDQGVQLTTQAQKAIKQLAGVIEESAQLATQVVSGGRQQQVSIGQIAQAMHSINQTTIQSLDGIRRIENAAQDLNELAGELDEIVMEYQL